MAILKEEIFAPILYIVEFDDLDQAIHWHNDVPQGLSSSPHTMAYYQHGLLSTSHTLSI